MLLLNAMPKKKKTYPEAPQVKRLFESGLSVSQVASKLNLNYNHVRYLVFTVLKLRREIPKKARQLPEKKIQRILHLYRWGYEPSEIQEDVQTSLKKIQNVIETHQVRRIAG